MRPLVFILLEIPGHRRTRPAQLRIEPRTSRGWSGEAEGGDSTRPTEAGGGKMRIQWMGGNKNRPGNPRTTQTSGATDGFPICFPIFSRFAPVCTGGRDAGRRKFWRPPAARKPARSIGRSSRPTRPIATAPNENPVTARASPPAAIWMFARTRPQNITPQRIVKLLPFLRPGDFHRAFREIVLERRARLQLAHNGAP